MRRGLVTTGALALAACSYPRLEPPVDDDAAAGLDAPVDAGTVAPPIDAPDASLVDARLPELTGCQVPLRVETATTATIRCTVVGAAAGRVGWSVTVGEGSFEAQSGAIDLDGAGQGVIALAYTAPATAGDAAHTIRLDGVPGSRALVTRVRTLSPVGESAAFADSAGLSSAANYLYGQALVLAEPAVIMKLGMWSDAGGALGRLAVYREVAGAPSSLEAATATAAIGAGKTELAVTEPVLLAAGTYWIMGNFDAATPVRRGPAGGVAQAYVVAALAAPLPATLASVSTTSNRKLNYYAMVAP